MSDKAIEDYGKGYLLLLLPISFLIIFLVTTWRILLAVVVLALGLSIWQHYQWQRWCLQVNPIFNQLLLENQGKVTPIDLAMKCNFSGKTAKRYLDSKAEEFGAHKSDAEDGSKVYYFLTAKTLGSILESSEPTEEIDTPKVSKTAMPLLVAPPPKEEKQQEPQTESTPPPTHEEKHVPLEKQLVFGSLIQSELAKRLNVYSSTVYKRRNDPEFPEWSRNRDPDGIAWTFSEDTKEFFPLEEEGES
ncbi:MAG: hypothetical protein QNJ47_27335 [Nostocaceae cyanobacterium]|nr:hypothetical protein [Nostocaceae cyanobacterium]